MKSQHLSISFAEFELMPQPFGWKVEYYNDKAHLTPRENVIKTNLSIQKTVIKTDYLMQAVDLQYKPIMIDGFYQAFRDSVEFCDWKKQDIQKHAEQNINDYFAAKRGQPLTQSVMVLEPKTEQLIGLALFVVTRKQRYKLDLLLVKPDYQRQGLATAMVSYATSQLYEINSSDSF
jgi:Acetyltransferase (GNAT) family